MFSNFDFDVIRRALPYLFYEGMTFTLTLTALSALGGLAFGTLLAMMRLSGLKLLARVAGLYVDLMRSLPLVLVIFWFYFLMPYIGQWLTGATRPIRVGAFASSLITFIMFEAAYFSEIMRAGIQSISKGQPAAAQALGLNYSQTMRYVVLPQAFRNMLSVLRARWRNATAGWLRCTCSRRWSTSRFPVSHRSPCAACRRASRCCVKRDAHDRDQPRQQILHRGVSGAEGLHHLGRQGRGGGGVRPFRLGQIDLDQMRQCAGAVPERRHHCRRHQGQRPQDRPSQAACPHRHGVPAFRAVSASADRRQSLPRAGEGARPRP